MLQKEKSRVFQLTGIFIGIAGFIFISIFAEIGENGSATFTAAVAFLMSVWWITEAVPLAVTSLIPLILFPATGILSGRETAEAYANSTIFLFLGGFIIALAMEKWNLHKRIALFMISLFGRSPSSIILGFMAASAIISMWISNTATAVMLLPIGLAVLFKLEEQFGRNQTKTFGIALMLGIAYSCSVGGVGTIIGTPPNLVFQRIYAITFPDEPQIHFSQWMKFAVPLSAVMLFVIWLVMTKVIFKIDKNLIIERQIFKDEKRKLGEMSFEEKSVLAVFISAAMLWITRHEIDTGVLTIPGWSELFSNPALIDDGTVAIAMAILLFLIPAKSKPEEVTLLDLKIFRKIPWEIILLFGGGFALAEGFVSSGLSKVIGEHFAYLEDVPVYLLILLICLSITFLTELTSNTATAQIILPILAALSIQIKIDPMLLMIPATISASMAFMMPVATPPNAIVFGSSRLRVLDMAKAGIIFNLIGAVIISTAVYFYFA